MVDPIFTYVGGIAFLVLIIGTMLYLTFSTLDIDEGDEYPSESVVKGVGVESDDEKGAAVETEAAEPVNEEQPGLAAEEPGTDEETEEVSVDDANESEDAAEGDAEDDGEESEGDETKETEDAAEAHDEDAGEDSEVEAADEDDDESET
ncbi:hypothetical protein Halar_1029 [halophilic archaeon DL31]|jgi:type IV secretory pathway VirB10-like protein|nr:hypothetical protein Halar_1029 [halophilic archaeon DL31]